MYLDNIASFSYSLLIYYITSFSEISEFPFHLVPMLLSNYKNRNNDDRQKKVVRAEVQKDHRKVQRRIKNRAALQINNMTVHLVKHPSLKILKTQNNHIHSVLSPIVVIRSPFPSQTLRSFTSLSHVHNYVTLATDFRNPLINQLLLRENR